MTEKTQYCFRHPNIAATDSCFLCGKKICFNCRIEFLRHVFCSMNCLITFVLRGIVLGLITVFKWIFRILFWPFRLLKKLSFRNWIRILIALALLIGFFLIWKMSRRIQSMEKQMAKQEFTLAPVDTAQLVPQPPFQSTEGGMVFSNAIDISGEAEENRIVVLSIDSKVAEAILPKKNRFEFKDVKLHRGQNRIEVRAITQEGAVSILQTIVMTYATPTLPYLIKEVQRGPLNRKEIALTFDGGSINNAADEILDALKINDVHCTFFLTGEFIRRYPGTVKRILQEGHEVGNHTWSHPHLTSFAKNRKHETLPGITSEKIRQELSKTASLFKLVTGKEMAGFWRAPYGEYNAEILRWSAEAGYKHIGWTVGRGWEESMDSMDWVADKNSTAYHSADEITEKILKYGTGKKYGANGAIVLMHLGTDRKEDFPHQKLPEIIEELKKQGYRLVRMSDMENAD
jgi:peptidoglycan/xylan/chitin deacetylase (PgdA/CDA1 family)